MVIAVFVAFLGKSIVTNTYTGEVFGELMGQLPFAKNTTDVIVKVMGFKTSVSVYTTSLVLTDLIVLSIMATITPFVNDLPEKIFLHTPQFDNWRDQEDYIESAGYKIKEAILAVVTAPPLALLSAWLASTILDWLANHIGDAASIVVGALLAVGFASLSLLPLIMGTFSVATAIAWRLLFTLGGAMIKTVTTNVFCLLLYLSLTAGSQSAALSSIVAFFAVALIYDFAFQALRRVLA